MVTKKTMEIYVKRYRIKFHKIFTKLSYIRYTYVVYTIFLICYIRRLCGGEGGRVVNGRVEKWWGDLNPPHFSRWLLRTLTYLRRMYTLEWHVNKDPSRVRIVIIVTGVHLIHTVIILSEL